MRGYLYGLHWLFTGGWCNNTVRSDVACRWKYRITDLITVIICCNAQRLQHIPAEIKPRTRAVAICPAPRNPSAHELDAILAIARLHVRCVRYQQHKAYCERNISIPCTAHHHVEHDILPEMLMCWARVIILKGFWTRRGHLHIIHTLAANLPGNNRAGGYASILCGCGFNHIPGGRNWRLHVAQNLPLKIMIAYTCTGRSHSHNEATKESLLLPCITFVRVESDWNILLVIRRFGQVCHKNVSSWIGLGDSALSKVRVSENTPV